MRGQFAGIPLAVAVQVDVGAGIVCGRINEIESGSAISYDGRRHRLIGIVEQFHHKLRRVGNLRYVGNVEEYVSVVLAEFSGKFGLHRRIYVAVNIGNSC